ncbi:MAG: hypothetical protein IPP15_15305 [Saprospiraceae bacterium]|uniref:Uncharacterized protein n=1 Tax=Candidatus Opimibacter skivensis TaxID=2982028 RepID=A0A9D7SV07_9BACT|nr:hypothetical protein [Candidatus Opimibacter skivensis]
MQTIIKADTKLKEPRWTESSGSHLYTSNQLIDAFMVGKTKGKEEFVEEVLGSVGENLSEVQSILSDFYNELTAKGISPKALGLKRKDSLYFEAAYVIDKAIYNSSKIKSFFRRIVEIETELNESKNYELRIMLIPLVVNSERMEQNLVSFDWFYDNSPS